jgi:magnesium transporter
VRRFRDDLTVIVDAAVYRDGRRVGSAATIDQLAALDRSGGFAWLGLRMPSSDELVAAQDAFTIPELAIEDALNKHDRPKVERHGACLLTVTPTAKYVDSREVVEFGEIFVYTGDDYVVTVRYGPGAPLTDVRAELEAEADTLRHGPGAVLHATLAHVVASYRPVVAGLEHDVREVERDVFSESRRQPTQRIYFLIREVLDFLVALEPMAAAVRRLVAPECGRWVPSPTVPLFTDIDDDLSEIVAQVRNLHQLLNNALSASLAQVSLRQNEDTRRISAWVAIGVVPTIVAGLFGMNVGGIPGSGQTLGFVMISAVTVLVCALLYRAFKRADWL